jgi:hypothetical protein
MPPRVTASMPEGLDLPATYSLRFGAIDATTGDDVTGVLIDVASLVVTQLTPGGPEALATSGFVPLLIPLPETDAPEGT